MSHTKAPGGRHDFEVTTGVDHRIPILWRQPNGQPTNLTGFTAFLDVRRRAGDVDPALLEFTSTPTSGITLGGVLGTIEVVFEEADTALLPVGFVFYDLIMVDSGGGSKRLLHGKIKVNQALTIFP